MDNTKKNDRRISIVLNGKEKLYEELVKDKQVYEEILNEEISAMKEEESSEEFEWILPEPSENQSSPKVVDLGERRRDKKKLGGPYWDDGKSDTSPKLPHIKRKKRRRFDIKSLPLGIIGIVFSAIIVGLSFGFMMITIFTGDKTDQIVAQPTVVGTSPTEAPVSVTPGQIPILGVEVVQGGAYTVIEKGNEKVNEIQADGYAATLTTSTEPAFLFIGIGLDREQASIIGDVYKDKGQEIYLKPYAITSNGMVENQNQAIFLETAIDLYQQLTLLSVNGLANGGTLLTEETLSELSTKHEKLTTTPFEGNETQEQKVLVFQNAITNAYEKMQAYANSKDATELWKIQQFLLNGLVAYEELTKTF
ncbi:hypothetical protein H1D32_07000 [Anaerobacillus sp. CMMVII]|uniref:hypothetical protein n=1 Tax=Anaerobacillus sp. CMMVII TaxID=2755588 RepID=UPI0021B72D74|nr:hypothetical protein [Anaerobacillus sp. CMMVII]MCT8137513.1 hypothetical protein [Anaerobacillus sp. CMMVII]